MSLGNSQQQNNPNHRSLTGFVTKLVGDGAIYGFINDEIFFQQAKVASGPASVGDQVFAECEYSANLPIKWNATSVKIINKVASNDPVVGTQQQQHPMSSDQVSFNAQNSNLAYQQQQHRDQGRLVQQQPQHQDQVMAEQQQQQQHAPARLLPDPKSGGEFAFASQDPRVGGRLLPASINSNPQEPPPVHQSPMGPPNFAFTPQMGPAFVQPNQFVPSPFVGQQQQPGQPPAHMLPHQQPQHLLPHSNTPPSQLHHANQQTQHNNQRSTGGRFSNDKGENRQRGNRGNKNQDRNDNNKFNDRPRSNDRDGSLNRQSKLSKDNKDTKAIGKRDDSLPTRPSPPAHQQGPDRVPKQTMPRRHYDVQNIPKTTILTNVNAYNIRQRCPSSVHVPSDLKEIFVNKHFRLDLRNIPKPLRFTIEPPGAPETTCKVDSPDKSVSSKQQDTDLASNMSLDDKTENKSSSGESAISTKTDLKMNHKYGVKLLLISLPSFQDIYQQVFGPKLDSFNPESGTRPIISGLDDVIQLLCSKGSNNGYSLIGGKFDPNLDGFIAGSTNKFERNGRQPDLIATCKRVVKDQIGLDLSSCKSWTLLSTFIYNNKNDYFSPKASIEYSYIYIPHIWTLNSVMSDDRIINQVSVMEPTEGSKDEKVVTNENKDQDQDSEKPENGLDSEQNIEDLENLSDDDLKKELSKLNISYQDNNTREELISSLKEYHSNQMVSLEAAPANDTPQPSNDEQEQVKDMGQSSEEPQLEEGEVISSAGASDNELEQDDIVSGKRKLQDDESSSTDPKKPCINKEVKVELITDAFPVRPKDQSLQLSLVSLHETHQPAKYDQFELSVVSNILKETLVQHFSEYIMTAFVEDSKQKKKDSSSPNAATASSSTSSQDATSDTNNNTKSTSKNNTFVDDKTGLTCSFTREYPVARYLNLAFTYFDVNHMGYLQFEDISRLFNNTGLTISKRALASLIGDCDKFNYRAFPDLSPKLPPTYVYEYPAQFCELPGSVKTTDVDGDGISESNITASGETMFEYKGVLYDLEKLIQEARDAEALRVNMVDRFNFAIENSDKQAEEIHVLEVSRNSLAKAIKSQNDEICDLKRERDSFKKKVRYMDILFSYDFSMNLARSSN